MDYRNAIKYFSLFLRQNKEDLKAAEARFYKGRSHEEIGENEEAIMEYRSAISQDKTLKWGREANRRIIMLGEFYDYRTKMSQEAEKQLQAYQDESFMSTMNTIKSIMPQKTQATRDMLSKLKQANGIKSVSDDNAIDLLNAIGDLDLTGKNGQKMAEVKEDNATHPKPIENTAAGPYKNIRDLEREKILSVHPFRRPAYIKTVVDENVKQLQYIYNKELRRGNALSGKILVEIAIRPSGAIQQADIIQSTMGDKNFEALVISKINIWLFRPVPDSLGILKIRYPFEFYEEK
jgi:TonB family protein